MNGSRGRGSVQTFFFLLFSGLRDAGGKKEGKGGNEKERGLLHFILSSFLPHDPSNSIPSDQPAASITVS
jgi:hypothetical protein